MIVTFLGQDTLMEPDFRTRLMETLEHILTGDEIFEFLVADVSSEFYAEVLSVLKDLRAQHPEKEMQTVTATLLRSNKEYYLTGPLGADKYVFPLPPSVENGYVQIRQLIRWCIDQSQVLVSYFYDYSYDNSKYRMHYARAKGLVIYDVSSEDTQSAIIEHLKQLSDSERLIVEGLHQGRKSSDIAKELGCVQRNISRVHHQAGRKIKELRRKQFPDLKEKTCYEQSKKLSLKCNSCLILGQNAHLDSNWQKQLKKTVVDYLSDTVKSYRFLLMGRSPFTREAVETIMEIKKQYPEKKFCFVCVETKIPNEILAADYPEFNIVTYMEIKRINLYVAKPELRSVIVNVIMNNGEQFNLIAKTLELSGNEVNSLLNDTAQTLKSIFHAKKVLII